MKEKFKSINIKNKNAIIIIIICSLLIILLRVAISNNQLNNNLKKEIKQENEQQRPTLSFIAYDNQDEQNIKGLISVDSINAIDYIEFSDGIKVYGNGKNKIKKDVQLEKNKEYNVKISSNGVEKIEKITVDDSYLEKMISFKEIEIPQGGDKEIEIQDNRGINGMTTWYKIGKNSNNWNMYNGKILLDQDYYIDIEDYVNKNYVITICTNTIDKAGNCFLIDKTFNVSKKGNLNLLKNAQVSGTLIDYGFTKSLNNCANSGWSPFDYNSIGAGRYNGTGSYSGTFKLDYTKLRKLKAKELNLRVNQYSESGSWVQTKITIFYTDGTSHIEEIEKVTIANKSYNPKISLQQDKEIDYIEFYIVRT